MASEAPICRAALNQANVRWPGRLKTSDGIMPSAAHTMANPVSKHEKGEAVDITHAPAHGGPDCSVEATRLVERAKSGDAPWLELVIFNHRIASARRDWHWRPYGGKNPHTSHMHIDIDPAYRNADVDWWDPPTPAPREDDDMTPEQAKQLREVHAMLKALVRPRRGDKQDHDPAALDLGDLLTAEEEGNK